MLHRQNLALLKPFKSKAVEEQDASTDNNKDKVETSPVVVGTDVMSVTFCVSAWFELLSRVYLRLEERTARQTCKCCF